ncbi:hypothetical protein HOY80DRAFT_1136414 [Tuber brumale]|nr:hypothetical protein HOY80DRAFT_1136414 [Tuber brumale]
MPRKQPPTPRTGPKQTRLAGLNHHTIKNVRTKKSSKSPAPPRQSALSSFGFSKGAATTTTSSGGSDVKKRVYASDDEIAETQFGLATQSFEGEEMVPPETPKRRRREVPSSHSPPGSPWTPKGAGGGIPFRLGGEGEERVIKSSQWWENEELCISTQRSGGEEVLNGVEDSGNPFSTPEPTTVNSLSPSASPSPSLPARDIKQETQSPSPRSPSPQTTQEHSQVNIMTTTTQIPINFRDTPISPPSPSVPPAATNESEAGEPQESQFPYRHGDEILPSSPTQSMGEDEFERDDDDNDGDDDGDVDPEGLHAFNPVRTQQLPSSFYHHDGGGSSPPALPAVLTGGFSSQSLPAGEQLEGEDKEEVEGERGEEAEVEVEEVEEKRDGGRRRRPITVSQLLPSSLMETFPLPPPLSQFSSYEYEVVPGSETQ